MQDIILLKQGEIVLKGLNKKYFEQKLISNVKRRLRSLGEFDVTCTQSTIYVEPKSDDIDMDETQQAMTKVFGIAAVVRAAACDKTPEAMAQKAIEYMAEAMREAGSFKVETRRADKAFPMTSIEVSQYVGGELAEAFPETAVDVHNPELTVHVEVRERAAYIHRPPLPGAGGLPVGCGGTAVTLLSGGIDSPVSTYMIAKRGVHMIPVHFFSFPYTSELAKQKVLDLAKETASLSRASRRPTLPARSSSSTLGTGLTSMVASSSSSSANSVPAAIGTAQHSPWTRPALVPLSTYSATCTRRDSSIVACAWLTGTLRLRLRSLTRRLSTRTSTLSSTT